jgi:hypothetical protein
MPGRLAVILALVVFVCPRGVIAQAVQPETDTVAPAHVAYVEGAVTLERDGRPESSPLNMPLLSGDRLKTLEGRVEILFSDGSALHLDARTTLDIQSDELVRLIDGRLRLNIAAGDTAQGVAGRAVVYRIDSPAGSVRITMPGEYRIALLRPSLLRESGRPEPSREGTAARVGGQTETQLELAVLRGSGEVFTDEGSTPVRAGERAYASAGLAPSYPYAFNSANWDAFDRWSESRRDTRLGVSTQYLPSEVRAYSSTFDEDGDWRYQQSYGYVWYPRVDVSWRPYYYGRWASYPRYGWTWIGADRFAWPTHHYGRWGFSAGAWFWIPARRWAPAHVSWAYAPGYVSWCPLGFDNRPVIAVNIFNVGPGYYSSARAWTAIGYSHFGRDYVHRRAVHWDRFDRNRRPSFQIGRSAPGHRDVAVPRSSTPIRWAGSRSLPPDRLRQDSGGQQVGSPSVGATRSGADRRSQGLPTSGRSATDTAVPRYINRGDEIVRSQTGRPSAPRNNAAVGDGIAFPRTAPQGPARRTDAAPGSPDVPARFGSDRTRTDRAPDNEVYRPGYGGSERGRAIDRTQGRPFDGAQGRPRSSIEPRPDNPAYQPFDGTQGRPSQPTRSYEPYAGAPGRSRSPQPFDGAQDRPGVGAPNRAPVMRERAPEPRPQEAARPSESARPRGGYEPPPPAPRAAPAPERSTPSRETAVPRSGGRPVPSAGGGTRSRGRGGS